jgi:hypothetical protein
MASKLPAVSEKELLHFRAQFNWPSERTFAEWQRNANQTDALCHDSGFTIQRVHIRFKDAMEFCQAHGKPCNLMSLCDFIQHGRIIKDGHGKFHLLFGAGPGAVSTTAEPLPGVENLLPRSRPGIGPKALGAINKAS